ncbi:hypothetical protein [Sphingobacterium faecale]|uniref:Uncharacterized protein n=1 Tax=Sphingobacterium faecale TaxID=2803775 RepID=A0ABS1R8D3_9SPHI|nr:hypothetical protein [Sphingobacterium faecale]MBL1410819.1 hypothetical protein [Sphingobacterium faecale]
MSILTAAVLVVGAAAMVSFTVKEKSEEPATAWFYLDESGNPDETEGAQTEGSLLCEQVPSKICAAKYHVDSENPNQPIAPTGEVKTGERKR